MSRQEIILENLERRGACSYQELADALGVSTMTIRREIDRLASRGAVIKTLGGAQFATSRSTDYETDFGSRLALHVPEKRAIAEKALELIRPGQTIFLDPSTTCLELAKLIARRVQGVTIVTNSALACLELGRGTQNTILGIGGQYDPASGSFVGLSGEEAADRFFVDRAFVSTKGFVPAEGTFESAIATIRVKQAVARRCSELVLLVDHSKFGQRALCKVLDLGQIHTVVTDASVSPADLKQLELAGKSVYVADATRRPQSAEDVNVS
ncbi:DeoR/GlpR family DNA-binding transcription regulator [Singulisphaera sp. PoT]|uniref:DeoR/GlpR family DNA-binding transcription regulator n=1 Tax=Singulisphaera sp. PoT TaxID=3411797 RepID=UPI003BF55947